MEANITAISALNSPVASSGHSVAFWLLLAGFTFVVLSYCCGLQMLGFAAAGVVQGSIAALWQSSIAIGNGVGVVAGSLFAILQSVAMGGIAVWPFLLAFLLIGLGPQLVHWAKDFGQWFDENVNVAQIWKDFGQWFNENLNVAQIWKEFSQWVHEHLNVAQTWKEFCQWFDENVNVAQIWKDFGQWFNENLNVAQIWKEFSQWVHEHLNVAQIWKKFCQWVHENLNIAQIWKEFLQWITGDVHEIVPVNQRSQVFTVNYQFPITLPFPASCMMVIITQLGCGLISFAVPPL